MAPPKQIQDSDCPLYLWRMKHDITRYWVANRLNTWENTVKMWEIGRQLPSLIMAFKLEALSKGAIPASSWLQTRLAKEHMRMRYGADRDKIRETNTRRTREYRHRKRLRQGELGVDTARQGETVAADEMIIENDNGVEGEITP